jgi:hypothetical protein
MKGMEDVDRFFYLVCMYALVFNVRVRERRLGPEVLR